MSGLFVTTGGIDAEDVHAILRSLAPLGEGEGEARYDFRYGLALGRVYRRESGTPAECAVVEERDCVVLLDGRLSAEPGISRTDSARVLDAYLRWGTECSAHMDGEFAFAIWDRRQARLLCACDLMGRRTVAFRWDGRRLTLATRVLAVLADSRVERTLDPHFVAHVLCDTWAQRPGTTAIAGVQRLRPGFRLVWREGELRTERADRLLVPENSRSRSGHDTAHKYDEFASLLDASVRDRMRSSSSAVLLSSGLDSAWVASSAARHAEAPLAFSITQSGPHFVDEVRAVEALLRRYPSLRWRQVQADLESPYPAGSSTTPILDDPVLAAGPLLASRARLIAAAAEIGVRDLIDGEGGDEIFRLSTRLGDFVRARAILPTLGLLTGGPQRGLFRRALLLHSLPSALRSRWMAQQRHRPGRVPDWITPTGQEGSIFSQVLDEESDRINQWTFGEAVQEALGTQPSVATAQAQALLAASFGLTSSSPFLDRRVVEFVAGLSPAERAHPAHDKVFLRRAAVHRLPAEVAWRPKREPLYIALLERALAYGRAMPLALEARRIPLLDAWVDFDRVQGVLALVQAGQQLPLRSKQRLYALLALAGWARRALAPK